MKINHIAIVVKEDLEETKRFYSELLKGSEVEVKEWEWMNIKVVMFQSEGFGVELLYSVNDNSPIADAPAGLRHITCVTDNLDESIEAIRKIDPRLIKEEKIEVRTEKMEGAVQFIGPLSMTGHLLIEIAQMKFK